MRIITRHYSHPSPLVAIIMIIALHLTGSAAGHSLDTAAEYTYPYSYYYCEDPGVPENGYCNGNNSYAIGTTLVFDCESGFVLYGSKSITCEQGTYEAYWTDNTPMCVHISDDDIEATPDPRSCGKAPKAGSHATIVSSNSTIVEYDCHEKKDDHVVVSGNRVLYCYYRNWHGGDPLECRRKASCPVIQPNQYIVHNSSGYSEGDITLFTCENGYALIGATSVTCLSTGQWSSQWPSCAASASCPYPSGVLNGQVRLITSTEAKYQCHSGYNLVGAGRVFCDANGAWNPATPDCIPVDCGELTDPLNGRVQYSVSTYNYRAYYYCNKGYDLVGHTSRRCSKDGTWTSEMPVCQPKLCPDPTVPKSGSVNITFQTVGGIATYSCAEGYRLVGSQTRQCLKSARWSLSPPSCVAVNCGSLDDPVDGEVVVMDTTYESVATYNCNRGKHLVHGSITRTCQSNGEWSGNEPQCVSVVNCGSLQPIANGKAVYLSPLHSVGSKASYTCNEGYILIGNGNTLVCNSYGEWEGSIPHCAATYNCFRGYEQQDGEVSTVVCQANGKLKIPSTASCEEIDCGVPPSIAKGTAQYNSTTFLSKVSYQCQSGYILSKDNPALVCLANKQWFGGVPSCEVVDCGIPPSISNGSVNFSSTKLASEATYSCDGGYSLVGDNSQVICNESGNWEGLIPSCVVDCGSLTPPNNNTIIGYPGNSTLVNSIANYSCLLGYVFPPNTSSTRLCTENGTWTEPEPVCEPIDCGPLLSPVNGSVRPPPVTTLASLARYSCGFGFRLIGSEFRICLVNGSWSSTAPTCQIIDCGPLTAPDNGVVQFNSTFVTFRAVYSCNAGFMISPPGASIVRACRVDGEWGGEAPTCQLINCGDLSSPTNGNVDVSSTLHGGTADYTCNTGYTLLGPETRTCGNNGEWTASDQPPPSCELVDCGDPGILVNGHRALFGTEYRKTVSFFCNNGFTIQGDSTRRCEANGQWTGTVPHCIANIPTCGLLDPPDNGYIVLQATTPGSQAQYGCNEGYEITGQNTMRTCGSNYKWNGEIPECRRITRCPELSTPDFSRRIGNSNESGSVVYFICEDGYDTVGSNARLCQDNLQWSGTHPSCVLRNASCSGDNGTMADDGRGRLCQCIEGELVNCCRHRRDWLSLSTEDRSQYIDAVLSVSSHPLYKPRYLDLMQLYKDGSGTRVLSFTASSTQFLPWHRYFLQQYEDLLRMVDPSIVLPYWDWTLSSSNPYLNPVFSPETGFGNSSGSNNCVLDGPFREDEFTVSSVSGGGCLERRYLPGSFLSRDQLDQYILIQPSNQFSQFFSLLTIPYLTVRCAVGGTMCLLDAATPTDDPLHILILAYLDSIWDYWQGKGPNYKLARYGSDVSPLELTNRNEPFEASKTPSDYHDNSNLPYGVSVCYGDPVDQISSDSTSTSTGNRKRSIEDVSCVTEDEMNRLALSSRDRVSLRAACRLLYTYIHH